MNVNIDLINKLEFNNGRIILSNLKIVGNHGEATFSMIFDYGVDFWKYRTEIINDKPVLSDFYSFRDEIWQSQKPANARILSHGLQTAYSVRYNHAAALSFKPVAVFVHFSIFETELPVHLQ